MVSQHNPEESSEEKEAPLKAPSQQAKVLQPLDETKSQSKPASTTDTPEEPEAVEQNEEAKAADAEQPATESDAPKKKSIEEATVDAITDQMAKKKPTKEDEEKRAAINKHIEEKTYFVPIGQVKKRRAKRRLLVLFLLILLLGGAYLAVDAELLLPDVSLPFELIK